MLNTRDARATWERYAESWKVSGAAAKRALHETCLAPNCTYTDPLVVAQGRDALVEYMLEFHHQVPGGHFVTDHFLAHHDRGIARWRMVGGDGTTLSDGISYCEYDADGRLRAMTGFFEPPGRGA